MKINSNDLYEYFRKITLNGRIEECSVIFDESGVKTRITNMNNTVMITALLKQNIFTDYTPIKERITFHNTKLFLEMLNGFDGEIELKLNKNNLSIKNNSKSMLFKLSENEFSDKFQFKSPNIVYEGDFKLKGSFLTEILRGCRVLNNNKTSWKLNGKTLCIIIGENKMHTITLLNNIDYKDFDVVFGAPLIEVLEVLNDNDDYTLTIKDESEKCVVKYLIANMESEDEN